MKKIVALILAMTMIFALAGCGKKSLAIKSHPADVTAQAGAAASFTVKATGRQLSYQWQYLASDGTWKKITNKDYAGLTEATMMVKTTAKRDGYQYRCAVTDGTDTVYSNAATLTVK